MARDWASPYTTDTAANQHTLGFGAAAVAGRRLVAIAAAPATIAFPAGWSELVTSLDAGELSAGVVTATGGENGVQLTLGPSGAQRTLVGWVESRDDLGAVHGTPVSVPGNGGSGSVSLSVTTTVPGCRIYAAVMGVVSANLFSPVWPSPLVQETAQYSTGGGLGPVRIAVASGVAASAGTYDITITGLGSDPAQAIAFAVAPASGSEPPAPANAIEAENRQQGVAKSTWDVTGAGDPTIQGFATATHVARGGTLDLKVHSPLSAWTAKVYRIGYYGGAGAREVATITGAQTSQPNGTVDPTTGMASCANWSVNGSWSVPADAVAGAYFIKVSRDDDPTKASHIGWFTVTDPARKAAIAVKLSDSTWQAYNHAGADPALPFSGKSLYGTGTAASFVFDNASRAKAVSYDRPLVTRLHLPQTSPWNAEYPLIRWLERLGYDVDYLTCAQVDADPTLLAGRDVVISSGHDEYWSQGMWDAHTAARDHATLPSHLVFLSGNEAFWRIRWDSGRRSYQCWKDTLDGALNSTGQYSGTWQDTRSFNTERRPVALLNGQRFRLNGLAALTLAVPDTLKASPLWRDTAVAALAAGQTWTSPVGIVGFEGDEPADVHATEKPAGLIRLSQVTHEVTGMLADDNGATYDNSGTYVHAITAYRSPATGAVVVGAGTNQYAWALDDVHDRHPGGILVSPVLQQALTNLLADLGQVPPEYPFPSGLVLPTPVALSTYGLPDPDPAPDPDPEEPSRIYATLNELKAMRRITDTSDDALLTKVLTVASRRIDARCNRRFWLDATPVQRVFGTAGRVTPDGRLLVDDIGAADGLVVETGSGTTWSAFTDYELAPTNALVDGWPYTELTGFWAGTRVRVTARWGWPAVPEDISMATLLLASRLFLRKDSPEGVSASSEFGPIRVSRLDPDVEALIAPYVQPKSA